MTRHFRAATCAEAIALIVAASSGLHAFYARPEVEDAPLERVIANLSQQVDLSPNNARLHLNLGRAHAMAWS